jgi:kinesin family protein 2/24
MEKLQNTKEPPKIRVVVRKRPLTKKELMRSDQDVLEMVSDETLIVKELK